MVLTSELVGFPSCYLKAGTALVAGASMNKGFL